MTTPDYKGFAFAIINFDGLDVDGGFVQDTAVAFGILKKVPYDPDVHGPNDVDAEPGDPWLAFTEPPEKNP